MFTLKFLSIFFHSPGLENEGWFDPWLLLQAMRNKSKSMQTDFLTGEVVGFRTQEQNVRMYDGVVRKQKRLEMVEVRFDHFLFNVLEY